MNGVRILLPLWRRALPALPLLLSLGFSGCFPGGSSLPSGQPAPDLDLPLLDGGRFQLASYRGQRVVMLDFWATWCGPCVQELPILAETAARYADQGVVFCAVNMGESEMAIRQFLEQNSLRVQVALDPDGQAARAYQVQGIPMLVLINKEGRIYATHVGYHPGIRGQLEAELDDMVAKGRLASREGVGPAELKDQLAFSGP